MSTQPFVQSGGSFFSNLFNRAKRAVYRWWEIRRLDPQDIEAIAYDLNISPAELVTLMSTSSDSLEQLCERLANAGLTDESLAASHPNELRDLRRVCSQCSSKTRCARDLRHKRIATPSKYCPNESTLRLLVRETCQEASAEASSVPARLS
jgi:hypothetical protein